MAKPKTVPQGTGLTRGKAILIGVLAVVLIGVVYLQYQRYGDVSTVAPAANTRPAGRRPPRASITKLEMTQPEFDTATQTAFLDFDQAKWQAPELPKVIAYDPFAVPDAFPQPARVVGTALQAGDPSNTAAILAKQRADELEALQTQLADLQQRGVHVVFRRDSQWVAMIGDRTVHIGDEINGFTVTEIDPRDGVKVERNDTQ